MENSSFGGRSDTLVFFNKATKMGLDDKILTRENVF